jgi:hypothetical protein
MTSKTTGPRSGLGEKATSIFEPVNLSGDLRAAIFAANDYQDGLVGAVIFDGILTFFAITL